MELDHHAIDTPSENSTSASKTPEEVKRSVTGFRWLLVCIAIFSANLLYGLDNTVVGDIQGAIADTFDDYTQLGWLGVGFTLGSVVFILPLGKAYAIFDTKWTFIGCLTMFAAGSTLCGASPNMIAMIFGRVWAGAGGAGMYLGNLNLITTLTTPQEQPRYNSLSFYLNLVIFGVMSPIYLFLLPSVPRQSERKPLTKLLELDWVGIFFSAGMQVSFILFLTFGGTQWSWGDGGNVALYVVFGFMLVAFILSQYYHPFTPRNNRLFPAEFLHDHTMIILYVLIACGGASLFVAVYYIPLYFQFVHGENGVMSAVRLLSFICFYVATILSCGFFMPKTGYWMVWYLVSGIFILVGAVLMYTVHFETETANIYGFSIVLGLGMATTQAGYAVGPTLVSPDRVAECIQFLNYGQGQSQLLGLAIASAIFQSLTSNGLLSLLEPHGYAESDILSAIAGAQSGFLQTLPSDLRTRALEVIVHSIDSIYIMVIAAGALYIVASCCLIPQKSFRSRPGKEKLTVVVA
ncbi:conserved hypothetical protein [Talaromyces stipitatus ATCC 10500]|uniref:Efflux pump antibiotic resistance protein n=1 Tax=Talaromyces stipitatus (strain ATCC 10500 / CBS 375.48 / QM 6759 / NRRL 1006) TaxID=441959 RepID=B8MQG6_TALSN|nr:uncharacterized protein TSTA_058570 [Talaromyces stipitatus ATCC 10500]EED13368.1 conserved hypothetical protein [Talaromyces stipitatus ATCC 10500]